MRLHTLDTVDSTNEEAFRRIAAREAAHLDVLLAREQTAGRGRRGAPWLGTPGESLLVSVVLMGRDSWSLPEPAILSMAVGLALIDAAEGLGLDRGRVALDWPNDLIAVDPKEVRGPGEAPKLAGILVETRSFDPEAPVYVVGVGANLLQAAFPPELVAERPVASLAQLGAPVEPEPMARAFVEALDRLLETAATAPSEVCADYVDATGLGGLEVELELAGGRPRGKLIFVEPDGVRILDGDDVLLSFALEHVQAIRPVG